MSCEIENTDESTEDMLCTGGSQRRQLNPLPALKDYHCLLEREDRVFAR